MERLRKKGGESMLEIEKVTVEDSDLDKENATEDAEFLSLNPPCDPEVGNCNPSAPCHPARPN